MVLGDKDCCASCGHGEIWHPTCCERHHRFVKPLVVDGRVLLVGDKFYFNFEGDRQFPQDPKGWIQCRFVSVEGRDGVAVIVKPKGFEKFIINRSATERFRLELPRSYHLEG